jgi:L-seryl-tRNA(Ser) seleniumtransferase
VVNNNAAAVLLVCAGLAAGREVVVSRGELIEIGGEFRIPDILSSSGATLREVGTTNRTHLRDYERAIGERTAFVLKVHPSNYRVVGFTAAPSTTDLAELAHKKGVPLVYDVGSGLVSRSLADEPVVEHAIAEGADLVCLSGDKLLGGPQAGIVVGRADLVDELRHQPLLRALRPDKMQLAALGATVLTYLEGNSAEMPLWRMIDAPAALLGRRSKRLAKALVERGYAAEVIDGESVTGGGSLPGHTVAGPVVAVIPADGSVKGLAAALRAANPPVVATVEEGKLRLNLRTVLPAQDALIETAFPPA